MHNIVFLAELKKIETCTGDISKSYLTASTTENIVFNAEPDIAPFGHAIHLLLINNALYGLKSYGDRFFPSMGWCDIWMCKKVYYY